MKYKLKAVHKLDVVSFGGVEWKKDGKFHVATLSDEKAEEILSGYGSVILKIKSKK